MTRTPEQRPVDAIVVARKLAESTEMDRRRWALRYQALIEAGRTAGLGSVERALPKLAETVATGTGASHASVWIPVEGKIFRVSAWPAQDSGVTEVDDVSHLDSVEGIDGVVSLADRGQVRCALAVAKRGAVTEDDRSFMRDVARCCALLFRGARLDTELRERVGHAEKLGKQLRASQTRLAHAREAERRRLAGEISNVTTGNLAAIRAELCHFERALDAGPDAAARVLARLRPSLDELIERFRAVVRGVYPGVLRDEGPRVALEELAGDLASSVRFTGQLRGRVDWELESGLYYVVASALRMLSRGRSPQPVHVHFGHHDAQLTVRIDGSPDMVAPSEDIRATLANDADRVAALGGGLTIDETPTRISVQAWLPEKLDPTVTVAPERPAVLSGGPAPRPRLRASLQTPTPGKLTLRGPGADLPPLEATRRLVLAAAETYSQTPAGEALLDIANRLDEPLRVALAGKPGAGKSTLLNALLGQELASTAPHGCTKVATWYRDAPTCAVTLHPREGKPRPLEFAATGAAAEAELAGVAVETVDHLLVGWPAPELRTMTLMDLPGREQGMPSVDAVVYVTPWLDEADLAFLRKAGDGVAVVLVLSRADERDYPDYRQDDRVRQVCHAVLPVSPLLAVESIRSDRVPGAAGLSAELLARSGIQPLRELLATRLAMRADTLKARSALLSVEETAERLPPSDPNREVLRYHVERIRAGAHEIAEIELLDRLHRGGLGFPAEDLAVADRLLGGEGTDPCSRLGLPGDADPAAVRQAAVASLRRWRQLAESPARNRDTAEACQILIRTCEGVMHQLAVRWE